MESPAAFTMHQESSYSGTIHLGKDSPSYTLSTPRAAIGSPFLLCEGQAKAHKNLTL